MAAQPPFKPGAYDTKLPLLDELAFRQWLASNNVPFDPNAAGPTDYDMRGYYRSLMEGQPMARPTAINPNDNRPHFTDYYKTPLHETFSSESEFAGPNTPSWINDTILADPNGRVVFNDAQQPAPEDSIQSIVNILMGRR